MPFFSIQNFRFGLDARRSQYTSNPGTLLQLDNCFVNSGGEIEKRKRFLHAALTVTGVFGVANFGLATGTTSMFVFGSAVPLVTSANILSGVVTYVQCVHPDGATAMTGIVSATTYGGLPWCIAKFADGNTYEYYNGVLVEDFISGLVLAGSTSNTALATALTTLTNATTNYTAVNDGGGVVDIFNLPSPQPNTYLSSIVKQSAAGNLTSVFENSGVPAVAQSPATAQFSIIKGSAAAGTNQITSVKVFGLPFNTVSRARTTNVATLVLTSTTGFTTGDLVRIINVTDPSFNSPSVAITVVGSSITYANTGANVGTTADTAGTAIDLSVGIEILNVAQNWTSSNTVTASNIARQINSFTSTPDYTASANANTINLSTTAVNAGVFNNFIVQVTAKGNVCVGQCFFTVTATGSYNQLFTAITMGTAGGGNVNIINGFTPSGTDVTSGLSAIAAWINNAGNTANAGVYNAFAQGNQLYLSKVITRSDDPAINVAITVNTGVSFSTGSSPPIQGTLSPSSLASRALVFGGGQPSWVFVANGQGNFFTQIIYPNLIAITGGVPPYTYSWSLLSESIPSIGMHIAQGANTPGPLFQSNGTSNNGPDVAQFVCIVTDSEGSTFTSPPLTINSQLS